MAKHILKPEEKMTRLEKKAFDKKLRSLGVAYPRKKNRAYFQHKAESQRITRLILLTDAT